MAEFSGMNVESIKGQVVPGLNRSAEAIQQVIAAVDRLMATVEHDWKGPDAKQFRQKWDGEHKRHLNQAQEDIKQLAQTARKNAENQTSTSASL